jgi:hypothetical protein
MLAELHIFLDGVSDDWDKLSPRTRYRILIGGAAFLAIAAGLCAL